MLTWTNVDTFRTSETKGDSFSFRGNDTDETLVVDGLEKGVTFRGGSIRTGGGDDTVQLQNYLPGRVDLGAGFDGLDFEVYSACRSAAITMNGSADCTTVEGQPRRCHPSGGHRTPRRSDTPTTRHRRHRPSRRHHGQQPTGYASTVVQAPTGSRTEKAADSKVWGGRGDDTLTGFVRLSLVLLGGRGDDILRGAPTPDQLYGGSGRDRANGRGGRDTCVAEVRRRCELPRLSGTVCRSGWAGGLQASLSSSDRRIGHALVNCHPRGASRAALVCGSRRRRSCPSAPWRLGCSPPGPDEGQPRQWTDMAQKRHRPQGAGRGVARTG